MATIEATVSDSDYLDLFKIDDKKYIIGTFQYGITVYNQQVRALNIFHALMNAEKLPKDPDHKFTIGIIGGGIGGLTFAAAALKAKFNIVIIEREFRFLHMQQGCIVRRLHPHIYDWPTSGSLDINAQLPVLSWRADTAAGVANQVLSQYNILRNNVIELYKSQDTPLEPIKEIFGAFNLQTNYIKKKDKEDRIYIEGYSLVGDPINEDVDMLVYAVGYGLENGVVNKIVPSPSYWRNEAYNQTRLMASDAKFYILGIGDGALVDLFRLCIYDFNYEQLINIFGQNSKQNELEAEILRIKQIFKNKKEEHDLFEYFKNIPREYYRDIQDYFTSKKLLRQNKQDSVYLCGKQTSFRSVFIPFRISYINAFLVFLLHEMKQFIYEKNKITLNNDRRLYVRDGQYITPEFVIDRTGTDRIKAYSNLGLSDDEMNRLEYLKGLQETIITSQSRWNYSDLCKDFDPKLGKHIEYFSPETRSICTGLVSSISGILKDALPADTKFRVALHRVMNSSDGISFQQMTSYFGTKVADDDVSLRGAGNVYKSERGNVGLSIHAGVPNLIRRLNEDCFKRILECINLIEDYDRFKDTNCFLAIPLMCKYEDNKCCNLVLYIDSNDVNTFTPNDENSLLKTLNSLINSFISTIEHLVIQNHIYMENIYFNPLKPVKDNRVFKHENDCFTDLTDIFARFNSKNSPSFMRFYSFDFGFTQ